MARYDRYQNESLRPPFAWAGSREVKLRIEKMIYPKPGAPAREDDFVIAEASLMPDPNAETAMGKRLEFGVKIKGSVTGAKQGTIYICTAAWKYDRNKQNSAWSEWTLFVEVGTAADPDTKEGIEAYLSEVKHIGPIRASSFHAAWGKDTITQLDAVGARFSPPSEYDDEIEDVDDVIESLCIEPETSAVLRRNGIGGRRLLEMIASYKETRTDYEQMQLLIRAGIKTNLRRKIAKAYRGHDIKTAMLDDPLGLMDIEDVPFPVADKLWMTCGIGPTDVRRIGAGIAYVLIGESTFGHCYCSTNSALEQAADLMEMPSLPTLWFEKNFENDPEISRQVVVDENGNLWARRIWAAEEGIAGRISALSAGTPKIKPEMLAKIPEIVEELTKEATFTPGDEQKAALLGLLTHQFSMLIGSAGCGKTTITALVIKLARRLGMRSIKVMAPTGAAARRATRATDVKATTIHLGFGMAGNGPAEYNESNPIDADLIIFDEVSMLDVYLAHKALSGIRAGTYVIFVGDSKQLAAVGPGAVLRDLMACGSVPTYELTTPYRNNGKILDMAYSILTKKPIIVMDGKGKALYDDLIFDPVSTGANTEPHVTAQRIVDKVVKAYLQVGDPNKVKAIVPIKGKRTEHPETGELGYWDAGTRHQNNAIMAAMLPPVAPGEIVLENDHFKFRAGCRCLWTRNTGKGDPMAMVNGQDFDITSIVKDDGGTIMVTITTENDEGIVVSKRFDWDEYKGDFELGFARTTHKSQGDGYEVAILTVLKQGMLSMENAYTAATRAKKVARFVGFPERMWNTQPENQRRRTGLARKLVKVLRKAA
jgi:exodeoxyribonuclease V alpha subunit